MTRTPPEEDVSPAVEKVRVLLGEWQRDWDALPRREKLRRRFIGWKESLALRKRLLLGGQLYTDEEMAKFPALAKSQRQWDAFPWWKKVWEVSGRPLAGWLAVILVAAVVLYLFVVSPLLIRTGHQHDPCGNGAGDPSSPNFDPDCGPPSLRDIP
jgi:hypothetical protein